MASTWARMKRTCRISSPPILANYFMSTIRDPQDEALLPIRPHGGAIILRRIKAEHNGLTAFLVGFSCSATLRIMDRVEQNVLPQQQQQQQQHKKSIDPKKFADAFIRDLNMLALVAALIAQLSLTTFALPLLSNVHWICKAAFASSLGFGTLAAWFSSNMARSLSSLDSAEDVKNWLSRPTGKRELREFRKAYGTRFGDVEAAAASEDRKKLARDDIVNFIEGNRWKQASFFSCFLLALPSVLLNLSIAFLLVAIAIYLGDVWGSKLDPTAGDTASRAVLICYTLALGLSLCVFAWASNRKDAESHDLRILISQLKDS